MLRQRELAKSSDKRSVFAERKKKIGALRSSKRLVSKKMKKQPGRQLRMKLSLRAKPQPKSIWKVLITRATSEIKDMLSSNLI